ncbi:precorrin-3B C(17)-methyltransferase [Mangrovibacterium marinum]|uniref:Cobalt-precorrin 3 C17-methyltransferase n=1 Tax=Mangrovibacterium marinum TaxID=1639118 RepID=A0A2T5C3D2_9BACT|nr:precorrin-3B C(17)-methyltransferase [Mangrovibacterium marinum]PTN09264.1 cobalt-precorrin 3 C17-methyltransferase [Mangrovibacterium marinum]
MQGKIILVGTGPGDKDYICPRALLALEQSDIIAGYKTYIELIKTLFPEKQFASSGMKKEVDRCVEVLELAEAGNVVSLISSGDAGIYGMAGIMLEIVAERQSEVPVDIIPGISAATSAASLLGAPLMNDFVTLSLSDLLTPWELIQKRIRAAGEGDFAVALYNPRSKTRIKQLDTAVDILLQYQKPETPVGIVKQAMREGQQVVLTTLGELKNADVDMLTTVIIGNSQTQVINGKMVTIRGYRL